MSSSQTETSKAQPTTNPSGVVSAASATPTGGGAAVVVEKTVISKYVKLRDGSRTLADAVATVSVNGEKLFLKDRQGEFLIVLQFEHEEEAQAEMDCVNEQLDLYEATRAARPSNRSTWRGARRR